MEIKREYNFPRWGQKDMYLLHHEEIGGPGKEHPGRKADPFLHDLWPELSDPYEMPGERGYVIHLPVEYNGQEIVPIQFLKALLPDPAS